MSPEDGPEEYPGHLLPDEDWQRVVAGAPEHATDPGQVDWREPEDVEPVDDSGRPAPLTHPDPPHYDLASEETREMGPER